MEIGENRTIAIFSKPSNLPIFHYLGLNSFITTGPKPMSPLTVFFGRLSSSSWAMWEMDRNKRSLIVINAILHLYNNTNFHTHMKWKRHLKSLRHHFDRPCSKGKLDPSLLTTVTTLYLVSHWNALTAHKWKTKSEIIPFILLQIIWNSRKWKVAVWRVQNV